MTALMIPLLVVILGLVVYLMWRSSQAPPEKPSMAVDPETAMRAAVDLHRIRRRLDAADLKHRQRREARRLKREIADALDDDTP